MRNGKIDKNHNSSRNILRVVGPVILAIGIIFVITGFVSFFTAFHGNGEPKYFWCGFVGMPLVAVGGAITKFGYMGKVARYFAEEMAPVGKDTFNYMAHGTKDSVRDLAAAVGEGLGIKDNDEVKIRCQECNGLADEDANFCPDCGNSLSNEKECSGCGEMNDADAKFCDNCGGPF